MKYLKMNGLGNKFIVLQNNGARLELAPQQVENLNAQDGKGFDQLLSIEPSKIADIYMGIWNNDGSQVAACGNGTRAVAWAYLQATQKTEVEIETKAGVLSARLIGENMVAVNMGQPRLQWDQIPLSEEMQTIRMELQVGPIDDPIMWGPSAVSMGNPHCIFFVDNVDSVAIEKIGPMIEFHPLFPEQTNVEFAQIIDRKNIRMRVWERGVGITQACGTGACATLVAAVRRKLVDRKATLILDGGKLQIEWRDDDNVIMTGAVELDGKGELDI
jgi:diaminopimelate epimerase